VYHGTFEEKRDWPEVTWSSLNFHRFSTLDRSLRGGDGRRFATLTAA
jgi:hypothetical protein